MRKRLALLLVLILCLTGCSKFDPEKKVECTFDGTQATIAGKPMEIDDFYGYTGQVWDDVNQTIIDFEVIQSDDLSLATGNDKGVLQENMTVFKGGCYGFSTNLQSEFTLYYPLEDDYWIYCSCYTVTSTTEQVFLAMYNYAKELLMSPMGVIVDCGDFKFQAEYEDIHLTHEYASVPGMISVKKAQKAECATDFVLTQEKKSIPMKTYTSSDYVYYQYGEWLIQTLMGVDLNNYLTF